MNLKKYYVFFIISLFALFFASCSEDEEPEALQILNNWDMEADVYGEPKFWYPFANTTGVECIYDSMEFVSASHSLRISCDDTTDLDIGYWIQRATYTEPGKTLVFEIKVKGENLVGAGAALAIYGYDSYSTQEMPTVMVFTDENDPIVGTFDWTTYSVEIEDIPDDIQFLYILLYKLPDTMGTVYFDDAEAVYIEN